MDLDERDEEIAEKVIFITGRFVGANENHLITLIQCNRCDGLVMLSYESRHAGFHDAIDLLSANQ